MIIIMYLVSQLRFHLVSYWLSSYTGYSYMHTIYAVDCWDLEGASVDKCGPMFPSAPQNLTATSSVVNRSTVMLWISWSPPARYNPDITMYAISINRGQGFCTNGVTADYSYK